jgi:hypothetical protein
MVLRLTSGVCRLLSLNQDLAQQVAAQLPNRFTRTRPADWVFDDHLFYGSSCRLNRRGREVRRAAACACPGCQGEDLQSRALVQDGYPA